jgi:hypothetical protein
VAPWSRRASWGCRLGCGIRKEPAKRSSRDLDQNHPLIVHGAEAFRVAESCLVAMPPARCRQSSATRRTMITWASSQLAGWSEDPFAPAPRSRSSASQASTFADRCKQSKFLTSRHLKERLKRERREDAIEPAQAVE